MISPSLIIEHDQKEPSVLSDGTSRLLCVSGPRRPVSMSSLSNADWCHRELKVKTTCGGELCTSPLHKRANQ